MAIKDLFRSRLVRTAVGVTALFVLTGANGEGCGGGEEPPEPPEPPTAECPPGEHLELICDEPCDDHGYPGYPGQPGEPGDPNDPAIPETDIGTSSSVTTGGGGETPPYPGECVEICVPDNPCPEGFYEELICEGWCEGYPGEPNDPGICLDPEGCEGEIPEPPPGGECFEECWTECIPVDNCGPGYVEEWVCEDVPQPEGLCLDPQGCPEPPPGECYPICVPDGGWCGPDAELIVVCDDWGCWEECFPINAECPPGMYLDVVCDQYGCYETCVELGEPEPGQPE